MIAVVLIQSIYVLLTAIAFAFELVPWTREAFVKYGRTRSTRTAAAAAQGTVCAPGTATTLERFTAMTVPKNWFSQFYWTGAVVGSLVLLDAVLWIWRSCRFGAQDLTHTHTFAAAVQLESWIDRDPPETVPAAETSSRVLAAVVGLSMYCIHIAIRLKECVFDQPTTDARMHVGQYAVGMIFYIATPFAIVADAYCAHIWQPVSLWMVAAAAVLFAFASLHQWRCHRILFQLRRIKLQHGTDGSYALPSGDLFEYVSSPHYLCEILVYVSLWMATGFQAPTLLCVVIWTTVNLSITAHESQMWYRRTFGVIFPQNRRMLLPFIW
ncbi:hypothetical protein IW142_000938 [Coemansia sp. RSA 564]|nr:hypothetical protein LPJ54_001009 [Coemansia sp. RSA 1824]KAJ2148382.1 hypothetical protein IW142_000938 [Coemansia sp. RSA 564]KAJ2249726.1 hypothetical protein GGH97_001163 [Coemansia sp. RSA 475]